MTVRVATLVLAYRYPAGMAALVQFFAAAQIDMFIHVDKKIDDTPFRLAVEGVGKGNNVFLPDRVDVFWRGFTMIEATIQLMLLARGHGQYDHFIIISDDSLPLVSPADLRARLQSQPTYLATGPAPLQFHYRYERFFMFDSKATQARWINDMEREITPDILPKLARLEALRKKGKKPIASYFYGSQWMAITAPAVDKILESWSNDEWLRESFEFSEVPDEGYFQTILGEAVWNPLTYVDWSGPVPPRVFKTVDEIRNTDPHGAMFIRKVDLSADEAVSWVVQLSR